MNITLRSSTILMKKTFAIFAFAFILAPLPVAAIERPVFSLIDSTAIGSGIRWGAYDSGFSGLSANTIASRRTPVSVPGTVSNLYVTARTAPGAGTQYEFTLYKNNVATAISCIIADTATSCDDLADSVTVAEGDDLAWQVSPTNTPANIPISISSKFVSTNSGETTIGGTMPAANNCLLTPYFLPQGSTATSSLAAAEAIAPTNFTLDKFYVRLESGPGAGDSFTYTVYKNGSPTSLTTSISDTNVDNSDTTHSVSFTAGDTISIECAGAGSPSAPRHQWGFRVTPTVDGETPIFMGGPGILSLVTRYPALVGTLSNESTEADKQITSPSAFDIRKGYASNSTAQSAGRDWDFIIRKNGVDGALAVTIPALSLSGSDTTNTESFAVGDLINWASYPPNPGTNPMYTALSAVLYVNPGTPAASSLPYRLYNLGQMLLNSGTFIIR